MRKLSKAERRAWWRSLTAEEQADYIFEQMQADGKTPNWDTIYAEVIKKGEFLR